MRTVDVIFKKPFNAIPTIVCTLKSGSNITTYGDLTAFVDYGSVTKKGFTIKVSNSCATLGAKPCVSWIATVLWNSNAKRKDITEKSISIDLQMYKTAIVFGTINTTSETLLLVTRQYNDVVVVESLHGASKEGVTGIVDSKANTVTITFPGHNSAIIIW